MDFENLLRQVVVERGAKRFRFSTQPVVTLFC